jgi:hypothetical protein
MNDVALEFLGYAASAVIAVSLMLVSVIRLRVVNLVGSALFVVYGLLIGAMPIVLLNILMVAVNGFHLTRLLRETEERLELLRVPPDAPYLERFLAHHADDIDAVFPGFRIEHDAVCVLILRDAVPSGLFVATPEGSTLRVALDYAIPSYRDLKGGSHLYERLPELLGNSEYHEIVAETGDRNHERYLERMGFERRGTNLVRPFNPSGTPPPTDPRRPGGSRR